MHVNAAAGFVQVLLAVSSPHIKSDEIIDLFLLALSILYLQETDRKILHRDLNSINVLTLRQQFS